MGLDEIIMWWDNQITLREKKAVVKLYDEGRFLDSVHIPTEKWPLNGAYEVFHFRNTLEVTDPAILAVFDRQEYKIGHCYSNTINLVADLTACGCKIQSYAGWLFTGDSEYPAHHCRAVLETPEGRSVLDLSDDQWMLVSGNSGHELRPDMDRAQIQEVMIAFAMDAQNHKNSERCFPVGTPSPWFYYVGCPCEPMDAVRIFKTLKMRYPKHECDRSCTDNGMSPIQVKLAQLGLMPTD